MSQERYKSSGLTSIPSIEKLLEKANKQQESIEAAINELFKSHTALVALVEKWELSKEQKNQLMVLIEADEKQWSKLQETFKQME